MNIFVGGLDPSITQEELKLAFEQFGRVHAVKICTHKSTGASRGFAFVTMNATQGGLAAIAELNGATFGSRRMTVEPSN
jgi:RNA recognition motif-containing protein